MALTRYTLDDFIHGMTDLVATQPDQATLERCRYDLPTGRVSSYVLGKYDNC